MAIWMREIEALRDFVATNLNWVDASGEWLHLHWSTMDWRTRTLSTGLRRCKDGKEFVASVVVEVDEEHDSVFARLVTEVERLMQTERH